MKRVHLLYFFVLFNKVSYSQTKVEWISTTEKKQWSKEYTLITSADDSVLTDVTLQINKHQQTIKGFGTCFNELGWTSLKTLLAKDRDFILKELFKPGFGANFTICRMPLGANDFSRKWYSYNETAGDFSMKHFNITNDLQTLIPYIKNAKQYNPNLQLWASPWSPPSWMKYNKHYALKILQKGVTNTVSDEWGIDFTGLDNGLLPEQQGKEGTDMFIQEEKYFKSYALYFSKFIQAYKKQGIDIGMVMPQNEFNSVQPFPSCTWTAKGLSAFIGYLGPQMKALGVDVFLGTMERPNEKLVDTILENPESSKYIKGVGFQWNGKEAIPGIHIKYPTLTLYQSEQECGNGSNSWKYATYTWGLMKHYLNNGASAYMYWNTSLKKGSISNWGWKQNSLVIVDTANKKYKFSYDYYILKHISHFVKPAAKKLITTGTFDNLLAFINADKSVAIIIQNELNYERALKIRIDKKIITVLLKANSFNTLLVK